MAHCGSASHGFGLVAGAYCRLESIERTVEVEDVFPDVGLARGLRPPA